MAKCPPFYSRREAEKPVEKRVYHNNDSCPPGRDIKANGDALNGTGGYRPCQDCQRYA
jgi:hypothetical protein